MSADPRERLVEALVRSTIALDRVEPLLERCETLLLAEASAGRNARTWADAVKQITSSGPAMAALATIGTLAVQALAWWAFGVAPQPPALPEPSHAVAPAGESREP